ncbi:glycerophosphoryl diester phosphodiesterase membrane domain-containing protein [Tsuneonella mangrovi]|uniref:glycerophosphoryl diester phosphodiesterase membrane domain-containing protein n=1 Tax=Tsuneonella mangrovi TaxID=1982042 RepID=UPI000BA27B93|nr:glycerophosphoryl diester phosphodiesterase membrane domain-containing protein [Tsuneonella mangrovi]
MQFDMTAAWNEAMRLVTANRDVLLIVGGVFFFLPYLVFALMLGNQMSAMEASLGPAADPKAATEAIMGFYGSIWWMFALLSIAQGIGMLGLLALLTDRTRPTVGQALAIGARLFIPYIAAQIIMVVAVSLLIMVPIIVGVAISTAVGVIMGIAALVAAVYLFTKFILLPPVIAIDRIGNPIAALRRSWMLTKGNSLRIFLFVLLLVVAVAVVGGVISMMLGLVLALAGTDIALIGRAILSSVLNTVWVVIFLAVLAAIHRQLAGDSPEAVSQTFE